MAAWSSAAHPSLDEVIGQVHWTFARACARTLDGFSFQAAVDRPDSGDGMCGRFLLADIESPLLGVPMLPDQEAGWRSVRWLLQAFEMNLTSERLVQRPWCGFPDLLESGLCALLKKRECLRKP